MQIGIIGAGKTGCSIGKYLTEAGISVTGYLSRTVESAAQAAQFTGTQVFTDIRDIVKASDTLFITTPDNSISEVWDCIAEQLIQEKIVCHFSGSLSSVVFSGIEKTGASGCSIHPMLAFNNRFSSYLQLQDAVLTIEGMDLAVTVLGSMFEGLGNTVMQMKSEEKARYHAAASMLSNQMIALYHIGLKELVKCGFTQEQAEKLVQPLVSNNVDAMLAKGPVEALTGPVERNDVHTVEKHLKVLEGDTRLLYQLLAKQLIEISECKNRNRDYLDLRKVLEKKGRK